MKFRKETESNTVDVNLTPLIDVVFLLLIFFMVSTTFDKQEQIQITLPEASASEALEKNKEIINIGIDEKGHYYVNKEELLKSDRESLRKMLLKVSLGNQDLPVIISADGQSPHQSVITVLDVASQLGLTKMTFATQQVR